MKREKRNRRKRRHFVRDRYERIKGKIPWELYVQWYY
jgi:hypothetical protein